METAVVEMLSTDAGREFSAFYREWFDRVYNYARNRTGSVTRADEIVSDTFNRVLDSWEQFDPLKGDRRTWLFSIAFRAVADHYRSETRRKWMTLGLASEPKEPPPVQGLE
ncbi:MAG: RNA polymerase sigma-70 factor, ECF subfamily, partial [Elusimicrobia bacterium]